MELAGTQRTPVADVRLPTPVSSGDLILDRRFEWARESFAAGDASAVSDLLGDVVASVMKTSQGTTSNGAQVGSGASL